MLLAHANTDPPHFPRAHEPRIFRVVTLAYQAPPAQMDDPFRIYMPVTIAADVLQKHANAPLPPSVEIRSIVSTAHRDLQKERVRQDGIAWDWFRAWGRLTWGHPYAPERVIGSPTAINKAVCEDGTPATELVGNIWTTSDLGKKAVEMHKAAIAAGDRGLGLSIEGNALERSATDPTDIIKAIVYHVAVDPSPINPFAYIASMAPFEAIGKAMGMLAKGKSLDESTRDALGPEANGVIAILRGFMMQFGTGDAERIVKSQDKRDRRAFAFLARYPDFTLRDAYDFVDDPHGFVAMHTTRTSA